MTSRSLTLWAPVLVVTAGLALFQAAYVVSGVRPSAAATTIMVFALPLFLVVWVLDDARLRRGVPCYDFAFFIFLGFPVSIAWYVLWTRRLPGLLTLGAFLGLYLAPWVSAVFLWIAVMALYHP